MAAVPPMGPTSESSGSRQSGGVELARPASSAAARAAVRTFAWPLEASAGEPGDRRERRERSLWGPRWQKHDTPDGVRNLCPPSAALVVATAVIVGGHVRRGGPAREHRELGAAMF